MKKAVDSAKRQPVSILKQLYAKRFGSTHTPHSPIERVIQIQRKMNQRTSRSVHQTRSNRFNKSFSLVNTTHVQVQQAKTSNCIPTLNYANEAQKFSNDLFKNKPANIRIFNPKKCPQTSPKSPKSPKSPSSNAHSHRVDKVFKILKLIKNQQPSPRNVRNLLKSQNRRRTIFSSGNDPQKSETLKFNQSLSISKDFEEPFSALKKYSQRLRSSQNETTKKYNYSQNKKIRARSRDNKLNKNLTMRQSRCRKLTEDQIQLKPWIVDSQF